MSNCSIRCAFGWLKSQTVVLLSCCQSLALCLRIWTRIHSPSKFDVHLMPCESINPKITEFFHRNCVGENICSKKCVIFTWRSTCKFRIENQKKFRPILNWISWQRLFVFIVRINLFVYDVKRTRFILSVRGIACMRVMRAGVFSVWQQVRTMSEAFFIHQLPVNIHLVELKHKQIFN